MSLLLLFRSSQIGGPIGGGGGGTSTVLNVAAMAGTDFGGDLRGFDWQPKLYDPILVSVTGLPMRVSQDVVEVIARDPTIRVDVSHLVVEVIVRVRRKAGWGIVQRSGGP